MFNVDPNIQKQINNYHNEIETFLSNFVINNNIKIEDLQFVTGLILPEQLKDKVIQEFMLIYEINGKPQGLIDQRWLCYAKDIDEYETASR